MFSSSLRLKIIALVAAAIGFFVLVIAVAAWRAISVRQQEMEARAVAASKMIAQVPVAESLRGHRGEELLQTLLPVVFALDRNVMFAVFTDSEGKVLARHAAPESAGGPTAEAQTRLADPAYKGRRDWKLVRIIIEDGQGRPQQQLRVGYSLAEMRARMVREAWALGFIVVLLAAAGVAGAVLLSARLTDPLERLTQAMRRVRYGELGSTVDVPSDGREDEVADLARAFNEMSAELHRRERLRGNFARFVSSAVADKVLAENRTVRLGGERRVVTVLFADLRGFTPLAAQRSPEQVVSLLNECFRALVDVIPRYGGTLDKLLGDGFMATFNAVNELPVHEICAVMAGLEMRRVLDELNTQRRAGGQDELQLGIGINTGEVVSGTFGSEQRLEYTVVGSAVNIAQRIEDHARGGELLISETTHRSVQHLVEAVPLERVLLKGLESPMQLYRVVALNRAISPAPPSLAPEREHRAASAREKT